MDFKINFLISLAFKAIESGGNVRVICIVTILKNNIIKQCKQFQTARSGLKFQALRFCSEFSVQLSYEKSSSPISDRVFHVFPVEFTILSVSSCFNLSWERQLCLSEHIVMP